MKGNCGAAFLMSSVSISGAWHVPSSSPVLRAGSQPHTEKVKTPRSARSERKERGAPEGTWPGAVSCPDPKELTLGVVRCQSLPEPQRFGFSVCHPHGVSGHHLMKTVRFVP